MQGSLPGGQAAGSRASLACRVVDSSTRLAAHFAVRRQVFVHEQQLFATHDCDAHDAESRVVHVVGLVDGVVCGTVRLYPVGSPDTTSWQGDRLAVLPAQRHLGLAAPLVRFAVATASQFDARTMLAHVQLDNVGFFEKLGWRRTGAPELYVGVRHQRMLIDVPVREATTGLPAAGSSPTRG